MTPFAVPKLLSLISSHLFIFAFISFALGDRSKTNILFQLMSKTVLPKFSSRSFMVSCLTLRSILTLFLYMVSQSVQSLSRVWLFATPWVAAHQAFLSISNSWSLLKLMSIELVILSNHLILCHPLLLLPSIFSSIRIFSKESDFHISWPKYWSFSFSISLPMNIQDWFPLGWTVGSPCSPRDSQESSPTPQFKSINSSALSFLYSPTLTSIHDYWKNHSFD